MAYRFSVTNTMTMTKIEEKVPEHDHTIKSLPTFIIKENKITASRQLCTLETEKSSCRSVAKDLEGLRQLTTDTVRLTTQLVEAQHSRLDWISSWLFPSPNLEADRAAGPAGWVYNSIHAINGIVGTSLGLILSQMEPLLGEHAPAMKREQGLAILNGVIGDYLQVEENPLAIRMQFRVDGVPQDDEMLKERIQQSNCHVLVLIHGCCSNDLLWSQDGHDHGSALAKELGMTPLYLYFNSGLHISENGKLFARQLNRLVGLSKRRLTLHILAHSMGGLVARSACYYAEVDKEGYNSKGWLAQLQMIIFLGTPHHGAMLERGGKWVDYLLGVNHYSEPLSWLGKIRSKGVTDLGYGNVRDEDWFGHCATVDRRQSTPLPNGVQCYAIAAVSSEQSSHFCDNFIGDGLVTVSSAMGQGHPDAKLNLLIPSSHQKIIYSLSHFGLLGSRDVYETIHFFFEDNKISPDKCTALHVCCGLG